MVCVCYRYVTILLPIYLERISFLYIFVVCTKNIKTWNEH